MPAARNGGGVKDVKTWIPCRLKPSAMLGMNLVTHQTRPAGPTSSAFMVKKDATIKRELYLGLLIDAAPAA